MGIVPFRKLFGRRQKKSEQRRLSRCVRTPSRARSPNSHPSGVSEPDPERRRQSKSSTARNSSFSDQGQVGEHRGENSEPDPGQLGLNTVYAPSNGHKADIVFIHGLGGASRRTWSKNEDPELFWPAKFLPLEPGICLARIMTFGYNANFRVAGKVSISVLDFAKDLLFDLKYAKDGRGEDLAIGNVSRTRGGRSAKMTALGTVDFRDSQHGGACN